MKIVLAQRVVSSDLPANQAQIEAQLEQSNEGDWVIFPEGMLSGYLPADPRYITSLDRNALLSAIAGIQTGCDARACHCLFGTAFPDKGQWFNATIAIMPHQAPIVYFKNNLAHLDRSHFTAGNALPAYHANDATFGIQMCRELLFPEQWRALKQQQVQVVFHINNAIQPQDAVWRHVLVTRALENQIYIVSVNNAASPQMLASCVISPRGHVLLELPMQQTWTEAISLDFSAISNYYLDQVRQDLARVVTS